MFEKFLEQIGIQHFFKQFLNQDCHFLNDVQQIYLFTNATMYKLMNAES